MEAPPRHEVLERRTGRSSCVQFPISRCYQERHGFAAAVKLGYDRMKAEEIRLKGESARLLTSAEAADEAEDIEHGPDRRGDELPDELARRQSRLAKIRQAKGLLEERARNEATEEAARRQAEGKSPPATPPAQAVPGPKDQ